MEVIKEKTKGEILRNRRLGRRFRLSKKRRMEG
jgi:hypothetical protein